MPTRPTASHATDCQDQPLLFQDLGRRQVIADFSGGYLSSDGGALLLRQVDARLGLTARLAQAFTDHRDPRYCDHTVRQLLTQRNLAEPLGTDRLHDPGVALAAPATLQRLEQGHRPTDRYHKPPR